MERRRGCLTVVVAALCVVSLSVAADPAEAQGTLDNGERHLGTISVPGQEHAWTFTVAQGHALTIAVAETAGSPTFAPIIRLRRPDSQQIASDSGAVAARVHVLAAPVSGTYTLLVASSGSSTGSYSITLASSPGAFVVPAGDEGGPMTNGANHAGTIAIGDLDPWTFDAAKDDALTISIGEVFEGEVDPGFGAYILLRGPDGTQLASDWGTTAARLHVLAAPLTGTYTVVVASFQPATGGHYRLTLARSPAEFVVPTGDHGGALTNGANHAGAIHVADLDQWSFHAAQGDALSINIGEVFPTEDDPGFGPYVILRGPNGAQLASDWGTLAAQLNVTAPRSGVYTVLVASFQPATGGQYLLTIANTPGAFVVPTGDEGGPMTNAVQHPGTIHRGDLDQWTFQAVQGAALSISIGEILGEEDPGFGPWIRLRGPDGAGLASDWGTLSARITRTAPVSGLYTVVVGSFNPAAAGGRYEVSVNGAVDCAPVVDPISAPAAAAGGSGTLAVTAPPGCTWNAASAVTWMTIVGGASGSGNGSVTYTLEPNLVVAPRVGTLTVAARTVTVTQAGAASPGSVTDTDGDSLPDAWELQYGLAVGGAPSDGAAGDPDGDGRTNLQELLAFSHPRGFVITYLAEGATGAFFSTRLALANPTFTRAIVVVRFQKGTGELVREYFDMPPMSRKTIDVASIPGMEAAEFSTVVEADAQIVADRTMTWDATGYGSHAERGIVTQAATTWYFAEGATHSGFALFFLLQNPTDSPATVEVTYLRASPAAPISKSYALAPQSRFNVWVNAEAASDPALADLAATDISAVVRSTNGVPIVAERAMYLHTGGVPFGAGHESAGVTALSPTWFFAEGATGPFFDLFLLIGNPGDKDAAVQATYLLPDGTTIVKQYLVGARSRFNIWVDLEDARLADTAVSTTLASVDGTPIVAERAMWWPGPAFAPQWHEAHNSPGATTTGTRWAMAEGESGGPRGVETYVLVANTSGIAGEARVTVLFEDGTSAARTFPLLPNSRFNVEMASMFPETAERRFGVIVESVGATPAQIVVERAMYADAGGATWAAGTSALATKLP